MADDFSDIDYSDPMSFFKAIGAGPGGLPMPEMISAKDVKKQARKYSLQIFKNWDLLRAVLDRHEPTIHKRWLKKTKNQRVAFLLSIWPNMSATHRPDFQAFRQETTSQRERGTRYKDAYMWPYINLEDLSKPKTLLLFLQARTWTSPDTFAMADYDVMHLSLVSKAIVPKFLNEYTMMFTNRKTPSTYGELISWDDNEGAFEWLTSQKGMHPGQGLIVLEAQDRVFNFLVEACKRIMHDIPQEELTSDKHPTQPPVILAKETVNGFDSLAVMASEAPYRPPALMDLERLESIIAAKKAAAEDHIWTLREDPAYFADTLLEMRDHRQETLKDTNGKVHPLLGPGRESIFWSRVIGNAVANAHLSLEAWSELLTQIINLRKLQDKYHEMITPEKDLPGEYLDALLTFRHYVNQGTKGSKGLLKHFAASSPPIQQFFVRVPPRDASSSIIQLQSSSTKKDRFVVELLWLLQQLWEDGNQLFLLGLTNVVDELERLIQSNAEAKAMLSPFIMDIISDMSVYSEATRQLNLYQPWAATFEESLVDKEENLKKGFARNTANWGLLMGALEGPDQAKLVRLGEPLERKFYYPIDKRRTKENVEAMQSAEASLDAFWSGVDRNMRVRMGDKLDSTALGKLLSRSKILQRTPDWIEPDRSRKDQKVDVETIIMPLSELYLDLQQRTERTIDQSSRAGKGKTEKVKTKGSATAPSPLDVAIPHEAVAPTRFSLDTRALKVFRTLFYTPSLTATPGEVPWTEFLHAMVGTGFVPEKLYGSVWQFSPTKLDVERSIQFHEPHPSGKLPYKTVRRFGRRLNRAYGWEGSMFVPKDDA